MGQRSLQKLGLCKVLESFKNNDHLTTEGLEYIKKIKSQMNSKRISD